MNHRSKVEWLHYVNDELTETTRTEYEEHLYNCETCMDVYLQIIEESSHVLPDVEDEESFTDAIMSQIEKQRTHFHPVKTSKKKLAFYQHTTFHYLLAASLTVVLMTSGVFQSLTNYVDEVQKTTISEESPSITEQIMNRTFAKSNDKD